ncbi:hypothetical protein BDQ12DRAFT_734188 [Crucibulum laeve]|uniref:Uncharacterized protein n=1 Tax=Crucibulum laeve TaxID=68775 RepID=A0A5C3M420_9AGAR|nr:hypothetical protein BDQ12DRAFT_734188 [Crucibulum laeve]
MTSASIVQNNTPSSEKSIYFDASSEPSMQIAQPAPATQGSQVQYDSQMAATAPAVSYDYAHGSKYLDYLGPNAQNNEDGIIQHPHDSQGWLPATDLPDEHPIGNSTQIGPTIARGASPTSSSSSARAARGNGSPTNAGRIQATSLDRSGSRRSTFTNKEGRTVVGSTFINGAGTTGPYAVAQEDGSLHARTASAEEALTPKQKLKIEKAAAKDSRRLSKVIKQEAKIEKQALTVAIDELANLQKFQKAAVKQEGRAQASHAKVLLSFKKTEAVYLAAKTQYEAALGKLNAEEEALATIRNNAREVTEKMQEKSQEIDGLRTMLNVDERESEVKLAQLKGLRKSGSIWR